MDVSMEHVSSEDTVPPHPEGSNEETKEESMKVIYLESEKPGKGDEKDNEDVFTNNEEVEIIDKKKEEKSKGEDESVTDRSRAQENNNDDKAKGKIDEIAKMRK